MLSVLPKQSQQSSSSSSLSQGEMETRRIEIQMDVEQWKRGKEYSQLSEDCRNELEKRMYKEKYSGFYLQLAELTQ